MICFPNTKINIGLNIVGKRDDGFHNIESIFYPVPFCDILEINTGKNIDFQTSGLIIDGNDQDNLVLKAFHLLADKYKIGPARIHLHKQIPMGAGLGGGSADAASALVLLNRLFNLNLSESVLEELALSLGSDCPFFVKNIPQYVTGRGENLKPVEVDLKGYYIYLINNGTHVSTKEAYSGISPEHSTQDLRELVRLPVSEWRNSIKNDFEVSVFKNHPELKRLKQNLCDKGADYASMTGSGSTMYGLFKKAPELSYKFDFEKIIKL